MRSIKLACITICVTGNIASGKSTLADLLAARLPDAVAVPEPHTANPFLPPYLRDPVRWAFTAQLRYYHDYVRVLREALPPTPIPRYLVVDAGPWTNRLVYARYAEAHALMTKDEYAFYQTMTGVIDTAHDTPEPSAYLFSETSTRVCWERMRRRGWAYQASVELAYLDALQPFFTAMQAEVNRTTPTLALDSDALDFTTEDGAQAALQTVLSFLDRHQLAHP